MFSMFRMYKTIVLFAQVAHFDSYLDVVQFSLRVLQLLQQFRHRYAARTLLRDFDHLRTLWMRIRRSNNEWNNVHRVDIVDEHVLASHAPDAQLLAPDYTFASTFACVCLLALLTSWTHLLVAALILLCAPSLFLNQALIPNTYL